MKYADIPTKFPIPFANSAGMSFTRAIPTTPSGTPGQASLTVGFPPENFQPVAAGGVPPFGADFNGLHNQETAWLRWMQAGSATPYFDGTFSTAIGGYPVGAMLQALGNLGQFWISLVDDNTVNPDSGASANWLSFPPIVYLHGPKNYYVNAGTGNDSWDGLSATHTTGTNGPFATLQKAANQIPIYNLNGFDLTIHVADGAYASVSLPPTNGSGTVFLTGNAANPQNCSVTSSAAYGIAIFQRGGVYDVSGFRVSTIIDVNALDGVAAASFGTMNLHDMQFGPCVRYHISAGAGGEIFYFGSNVIEATANTLAHVRAESAGGVRSPTTPPNPPNINILGFVAIADFINADSAGQVLLALGTVVGAAAVIGSKYSATLNGIIYSYGGGASYYPGSTPGSTSTGGQYA